MKRERKVRIGSVAIFICLLVIAGTLFLYGNTLEKNNEIIRRTTALQAKRTYVNFLLQEALNSPKDLYTTYDTFSAAYQELYVEITDLMNLPFFRKLLLDSYKVRSSRTVLLSLMEVDRKRIDEIDRLMPRLKHEYPIELPGPYSYKSDLFQTKSNVLYQITVKLEHLPVNYGGAWDISFKKMVDDIYSATQRQKRTIELISIAVSATLVLIVTILAQVFSSMVMELADNREQLLAKERQGKELEIARSIQTSLLPEPEARILTHYDISTNMTPAEEVGGDYYDLIATDNNSLWMAIGDVSGHGLISGLIMMMVQTSIRNIINMGGESNPSEILVTINKTIAHNIKQLGVENYMTLTLLCMTEDGRLIFSGLHQDILVYRRKEARVEEIETRGMWIGLDMDMEQFMCNDRFQLDDGDTILLFTDGITEATSKKTREMFGQTRLISLLQTHGERDAKHIKKQLIHELKNYDCDDDFTFVLCKKTTPTINQGTTTATTNLEPIPR